MCERWKGELVVLVNQRLQMQIYGAVLPEALPMLMISRFGQNLLYLGHAI